MAEKENFKVRELYDRDGYTETTIMEESEVIEAVEKWLQNNDFQSLILKHGFNRYDQTFGRTQAVTVDVRDGKIFHTENTPNQFSPVDSFYIDLVTVPEYDADDTSICEGAEMTATLTTQQIINLVECVDEEEDIEYYLAIEKIEDGKYEINWWDNAAEISAEKWVEEIMKEKWDEWVSDYEAYLLEDIGDNWENNIREYYDGLREQQNQSFDD